MKKELMNQLIEFAMTERQARVYLALIKEKITTVPELFKLSGVPQNKIYEILKELIEKGYLSKKKKGKSTYYEVTDPNISFKQLIEEKELQIQEIHALKKDLSKIYQSAGYEKTLSEYVEVVKGNNNVHKKFLELLNNTKKTVLSIDCPPYASKSKKMITEQREAALKFFKRGCIDKSLREVNNDTPLFLFNSIRSSLQEYKTENNKIIAKSPIKLFIFDNEILMTFNNSFINADEEICASIIKQPTTVNTYIHMFNFLFEQAETCENWAKNNKELFEQKLKEYDQEIHK